MIAGFIHVNAFIKAVSELKENCCRSKAYSNGETVLKTIWDEIVADLENRIKEQDNRDKLSTFIKVAQNNLTVFADHIFLIYQQCEPCSGNCRLEIKDFLGYIGTEIIKILESLHNNYSDLFDINANAPIWLIYNNKAAIPRHKTIIHKLEVNHFDPELILILDSYLEALYKPGGTKIKCWRQFFYMQNLVDELTLFIESLASADTMRLIKLLIGFDFNPLPFYEFFLEYAVTIVSPDMPYEDQEMEWLLLLKTIENVRLEVKAGYNTEVPSILESISDYIQRELGIIAKLKSVMAPYPTNGKDKRGSNYYFSVCTTIEELFFLIRVMLDVRFIKTRYKANLYSFVSNHIKTDRSNNPSAQYMRNVFGLNRVVPLRIVKKIRFWLVAMISHIDSNFGDHLKLWFLGLLTLPNISDFLGIELLFIP